MRFVAWSGIGYVANDVYDYVMASKNAGTSPTASGLGQTAEASVKNFFTVQNLVKVLIITVVLVVVFFVALPKVFPKQFKFLKLKR